MSKHKFCIINFLQKNHYFYYIGDFDEKKVRGQVSLEYLLILVSFFAILSLILPIIFFSINQVFVVMDTINAREISNIIGQNDELFLFLSNNSLKKFEFNPVNEIKIIVENNVIIVGSSEKEFKVLLNDSQEKFEKTFFNKFYLEIKKENNISKFIFYE